MHSGTFAVISIACKDAVEQVLGGDIVDGDEDLGSANSTMFQMLDNDMIKPTAIEILTSLCLLVGIIQV